MITSYCESGFQSWPQHSLCQISWLKYTNHTSVSPFDLPHTSPSFMLTLWIWEEQLMTMCLWLMVSRGFSRMLGSREGLWADECSHSLARYLVLRRSQYTPILQSGEASVVHPCCCSLPFSSKHHGYGAVQPSLPQRCNSSFAVQKCTYSVNNFNWVVNVSI